MIRFVSHNEINIKKYDNCITESTNSLIYGLSWYLNCVTDYWGVLIFNDFEAVMPLPIKKKYGLNYIFLPSWVQQLGIFSKNEIKPELIDDFLRAIPKKIKLVNILFNYGNYFQHKFLIPRDNYILDLNKTYESLFKNFKKGRKHSIHKSQKLSLKIQKTNDVRLLLEIFKMNKGAELRKKESEYEQLEQIVSTALQLQKADVFHVLDNDGSLLGGAVFLYHKNRITYLFSGLNDKGRKSQANSFLINYIIHKNADSNNILDFEGSMIGNIASFYKSFGAVKETYFFYKKPLILF